MSSRARCESFILGVRKKRGQMGCGADCEVRWSRPPRKLMELRRSGIRGHWSAVGSYIAKKGILRRFKMPLSIRSDLREAELLLTWRLLLFALLPFLFALLLLGR